LRALASGSAFALMRRTMAHRSDLDRPTAP
jgi:hypothetical protein